MDSRAVSPVISTILMVAVVVIVGSIVGVFALGIAENVDNPAPQASFEFNWENTSRTLTIVHAGGDQFREANTDRLEVVIRDDDDTGQNDFLVARGDWASAAGGFPVLAGDEFTITGEGGGGDLDVEDAGTNVENTGSEIHEPEIDDTVRVVWYGPDGRSFVVAEYTIPAGEDDT
jgi:flagellin-like protein